jgi:hypothetical protein
MACIISDIVILFYLLSYIIHTVENWLYVEPWPNRIFPYNNEGSILSALIFESRSGKNVCHIL